VKSGLRRAVRPSNKTPVPMGSGDIMKLPGTALGTNTDLTLIRAYKSNGTVQSNVSMLATSAAGPAWKLYRPQPVDGRRRYTTSDEGSDQRVEVIHHAALSALNSPAEITVGNIRLPVWTRFGLFEISNIWLECTGKSHWVVDRGPNGTAPFPLGYWPVRPDRMMPVPDRDNYLAGWVYTAPDGREKVWLEPTDVIYNKYPDPEDPYGGVGPIRSVLTDVDAARYTAEWNRNFFLNSAEPGGVIVADHKLEDDEYNDLVNRWRDAHRGVARAHRVAVLENGQTWVPNAHTMRDMDFANLRGTSRDVIREALGMHKVMTGVTDDVNRANAQTGEEVFASWKIKPRLDRWRDVFNSQMLPLFGSTGQNVEFDYCLPTPVNREQDNMELTAKANAWAVLVANGADPDDAAGIVGLPKMRMIAKPPPGGLPPGTPGVGGAPQPAAVPGESGQGGDADNVWRRLAEITDSAEWRDMAAFNRVGAGAR
jgi:hypothetical protein